MSDYKNIALLSLNIKNFRSFGKEQSISFSSDGQNTRRVTAIVGLNATGKSNIFSALDVLRNMVRNSANAGFVLPYMPFLYNTSYKNKPTEFELSLRYNNSIYRYRIAFTGNRIVREFLKEKEIDSIRERTIFDRAENTINPGAVNYGFNQSLMDRTRSNSLIITKAIENNNRYANIILKAMNSFEIISCTNNQLEGVAVSLLQENPELIKETIFALKNADLSIHDIKIDNVMIPDEILAKMPFPDDIKQSLRMNPGAMVNLGHILKDKSGKPVLHDGKMTYLSAGMESESIGTRAFLGLIVPIIDSIKKGKILFIDEFGSYLHYGLVVRIINTYVKHEQAPGLVVNTHAGMILSCIDRDSTYVMTKDCIDEESRIHRLIESGARKSEPFGRNYYTNSRYDMLSFSNDLLF